MGGEGMADTGPKGSAREPNLKVLGGMETDLLQVEERARGKLMTGEFAEEELGANLAQMAEKRGQNQRRGAREAQGVHGIGVVAEHERSAFAGTEPHALLAE